MRELVKIQEIEIGLELVNSVNSRELHATLGAKKDYSNWIKQQIGTLGLEENVDYIVNALKGENPKGGRPTADYIITTDTAKHIAMASRTQKGKEVRRYFVEVERKYIKTSADVAKLHEEMIAFQKQKASSEDLVMKLALMSLESGTKDVEKYLQVYALKQKGLSHRLISGALGMTPSNVDNYSSKLVKLGLS